MTETHGNAAALGVLLVKKETARESCLWDRLRDIELLRGVRAGWGARAGEGRGRQHLDPERDFLSGVRRKHLLWRPRDRVLCRRRERTPFPGPQKHPRQLAHQRN